MSAALTKEPIRGWKKFVNSSAVLVALSSASYATSFLRERFFYQRAYGTHVLDSIELTMSGLAIVSNICGMVLAFMWVTGRLSRRQILVIAVLSLMVALASAPVSVLVAICVGIMISSTTFLVAIQRAADVGRQAVALLGAVSAVVPTLAVWEALGTRNPRSVLLGYLAGAAWQAVVAFVVGGGSRRQVSGDTASLLWPLLYMAALQTDGIVDQILFLQASVGWVGAAALARNVVTAATVIVVAPLSSQALAGRLSLGQRSRLLPISVAMTALTLAGLPLVLPLAIKGGAVHAQGYDRILVLSLLYALSIPFSTYWQVHTRAAHAHTERWRTTSYLALGLLVVHLIVVLPLLLLKAWQLIPLGTVVAFGVGTVVLRRISSIVVAAGNPACNK